MAANDLTRKGKRGTAAYIQTTCNKESNPNVFNDLLDGFLDPTKPIDDWDMLDWCRWIIAGGKTPDEYAQIVKRYDNAPTCGLVWTANFVAYRCRTCGISPCMSLCSDCFQRGNHEGHDFNMFRSQAGGACDCGDKSVMSESGFCHKHIHKSHLDKPEVPHDLLCVAKVFMPRAFLRLIQHFRDCYKSDPLDKHLTAIPEADGLLNLLHQHSELGAAMREVMTHALTNTQIYSNLAINCESSKPEKAEYLARNFQAYKDALRSARGSDFDFAESVLHTMHPDLNLATFLNELVFWTINYEFPQKLVCMLLSMMPDLNYKEAFTITFVHHYPRIGRMLANSTDSDTLSNRVVHVSVQLFSNEKLAYEMTKESSLLYIMVKSLKEMMYCTAKQSTLQCAGKNYHHVVDCSHRIMKEHCYWPLVSDLNNVLTHRLVALEFLRDRKLLNMWFSFLSLFQGMNVNQRELKFHVEFESNTYYAAFSAELEASATPMWALILHLTDRFSFKATSPELDTLKHSKNVLKESLEAIKRWLLAIGFSSGDTVNPYQVSFHLPLHRCFASFLCHAVRQQDMKLSEIIPSEQDLKLIMMHPLQAQVSFYEILAGMWVRCGLQIKGQAMTYIQCHFCNSIVDADLFLLQLCVMFLDPNWLLKTIMQKFHVWEWFTFHPNRINSFLESEHVLPMLEGALTFITTLIATSTNIGKTQEQVTRQEMVSLLCMSDRTHSQLIDLLPDKCGSTSQNKDFESILTQIAGYKAPNFEVSGTMIQGTFVPKTNIWEEEYDPIHILLRAVHRREYQASLDRYTQCLRQSGKYTGQDALWPPYRIPGPVHKEFKDPRIILHSKTMHGLIFTILFRALNDPDASEQILALCIYLLDMAVRFPNEEFQTPPRIYESAKDDVDLNFSDWFPGNNTLTNIVVPIKKIVITEKVVMSMGMVEKMEVEEEEDDDMDADADGLSYQVQSPIICEADNNENASHQTTLPRTDPPLALPSSNSVTALVPVESSNEELVNRLLAIAHQDAQSNIANNSNDSSSTSSLPPSTSKSATSVNLSQLPSGSNSVNMAIVPTSSGFTTMRPRCLKLKEVSSRHRMLLTEQGTPQVVFQNTDSSLSDGMKTMPFCSKRLVEMNESILSLLIALYSKLCGKPDAYKIPSELKQPSSDSECRIGTGVDFIRRLIDVIVQSGSDKEAEVKKICNRLWPKSEASSFKPTDTVDKEERRRKAKERQQKLMAEFASKQKAFLQKTMETETKEAASAESNSDEMLNMRKEYECVICGQTTVSEEERPMGMVVLLQATSVLGHSHQEPSSSRYLPCSDEERFNFQKEKALAYYMDERISELARHFDNKYWQLAVNIGWEGGVHVQSCGHYLHIACHKAYIQSLKCQNQHSIRNQNLNVQRGEYACPLCRQLANSVIPLNPAIGELGAVICRWGKNLYDLSAELSQLMTSSLSDRESNLMKIHMHSIMEDLTNTTYPQYRSVCSPNSSSLFLFLCSIARTNLEIELIQRNAASSSITKQKACFVPLLHVLSIHSRVLTQAVPTQIWTQLTGQTSDNMYSVAVVDSEVPLLLRDCVAILLQIILTLPLNIDKVYFNCIVQVLYNVVYLQAVTQLSQLMSQKQRIQWKQLLEATFSCENGQSSVHGFSDIVTKVIEILEQSSLYLKDEDMDQPQRTMEWTEEGIEHYIQNLCLHFVQIASLLQSHLYSDPPFDLDAKNQLNEFGGLCTYLGLTNSENPEAVMSASCLKWATIDPPLLIRTWCFDFAEFVNSASRPARRFLRRPLTWYSPALLKLPENYDQIFQYYHRRPCSVCHSVPKDPSLCLVCGTMVCLRENCCRQQAQYEAVWHSVACGAGTAVYLAVNSSTIIVIRGKRACLWGSVYLDSFGEEDRDLKRGKPLFLSKERYDLLQNQWLNHGFNHTNKRWVWHKDNL